MRSYIVLARNGTRNANMEITNYTVREAAKKLRCSAAKLYLDLREGKGPRFFKHGRKIRVSHEAIVEFISQLEAQTAEGRAK
jgi:excisionase family DNA binding protein